MDKTTTGTYRTKRDGGIEYTYEAGWSALPNGSATWHAKVYREGQYVGQPAGNILNTEGVSDMAYYVRSLVETSIEMRAGIQ